MTNNKLQMQEAQRASCSYPENPHVGISDSNCIKPDKEKVLKEIRGEKHSYLKRNKGKNYSRLLFMQARREWIEIFTVEINNLHSNTKTRHLSI